METQHVALERLGEAHCEDLTDEEYAEVTIKALKHTCILKVPRSWVGIDLKCHLMKHHPCKPELKTMKLVISAKSVHDGDSMDELLKKNWKESPITLYIIDPNMTPPAKEEPNSSIFKAMKVISDHHDEQKKEEEAKKVEERKKENMKKITLPRSIYFPHSCTFLFVFLFMMFNNANTTFMFSLVLVALPYLYFEVKKNINAFCDKKLRELNIPYESESQREARVREQAVHERIKANACKPSWDEEELERKYSWPETIKGLIYYFFASFFPDYIEKELDIFQREYELLQTKKKIREKKRDFERRKKELEEKKMQDIRDKMKVDVQQELSKTLSTPVQQPSMGDQPLDGDGE
ncbi:unnamed protein product [Moneuplotes crassus]|uniref:Uncharacterized protein n=1 Tax=Euplotes crassus TaxID=5936 RepID=A0AAD1XL77_EUPCR|nr:unnamed protein product [Moneuplotes crassus]